MPRQGNRKAAVLARLAAVALQVARELEDPFGHQIHQLDLAGLQSHFNDRLWVLTQRKYWRCAASTLSARLMRGDC